MTSGGSGSRSGSRSAAGSGRRVRGAAVRGASLFGGLVLACAAAGPVSAQDVRVVTFEDAVDLALERNTDLLRARTEVDLRRTEETREWMDFLPEVSVATRARRSFGRSFSREEGAILSESSDIIDTGVTATVELFDGLERVASVRGASMQREASLLRLERAEADVLFRVVRSYTELALDRELARVRAEELVAADELLEQVRRLVDLGRQPASDLYQQEAAQAEAEAALVDARRQVELTETGLLQLLELDPMERHEFRTPALPEASSELRYEPAELLSLALSSRPDLRALEAGLDASGQGVAAARAGYWPSLSVSVDYGSNWSSNSLQPVPGTGSDPRRVTIMPEAGGDPVTLEVPGTGSSPELRRPDFFEQLDGRRGGSVSLSLSLPVFDRLQTRVAVQRAEVARRNALYDLQDQRQEVAIQVRQSVLEHRSAVARQAATERRLTAAERAWSAAQRRYELGAATFVEVAQARSALVSARSAALRARFSVQLAQRLIAYHTGTLDPGTTLFTELSENSDDE